MLIDLTGKTALVTAASSGIGKATAIALAESGAKTIIASRNIEKLTEVKKIIDANSPENAEIIACDLSIPAEVNELIRLVTAKKNLDIFVSNTGGPKPGTIMELTDFDWHEAFELVLMSAVRITRALIPGMIKSGGGRLIYIASMSVKEPIPDLTLSNVYRSGLNALAKTNSLLYSKNNIFSHVICPGYIYTNRTIKLIEKKTTESGKTFIEIKNEIESAIPAGRYGSPEEVANLAVFLSSDISSYMSGNTIQIDGGLINSIL